MMKTEACERYMADPEANAAHLAECEGCAALFGAPEMPLEPKPIEVSALPLAPWEGASHRAWPLVLGGALALFTIAAGLFVAAGVAPVSGVTGAIRSGMPPLDIIETLLQHAGAAAQNAPGGWQIAVAILFVVVNTALFLLLRRAPKGAGIDA
jgi:hypothetical protein